MSAFGSLEDLLRRTPEGPTLLKSAGPVSDAFILSTDPVAVINGPVGSAKTTASIKKMIVEARRMPPWDAGRRTYHPYIVREKYDALWKTTIPSWWKIFPKEIGVWTGSSPRSATHVIDWRDEWGDVRVNAHFFAFGEAADPDDLRGTEPTDAYLNELDTLREDLFTALSGRLARTPGRKILGRPGRAWGDLNAPDVMNWTYKTFWEAPPPGFVLYRQPGGLEANAENPEGAGRDYYLDIIAKNPTRPWYVRRMVHNRPGFTRDADLVYPNYDDDWHLAPKQIPYIPSLPVIVGIDGGLTPAAVYMQELPNGQVRQLAEIWLSLGGMSALSEAMLRVEARRFPNAEFITVCDPAMKAGEETQEGSDRARLSARLHREVRLARTNDPMERQRPLREKMDRKIETGEPAFWLDPSCRISRRGYSQTYAFHRIRGTNERGRIVKNPDSHVCDAGGYAGLETGLGHARMLKGQRERELRERLKANREGGRYNPFGRAS